MNKEEFAGDEAALAAELDDSFFFRRVPTGIALTILLLDSPCWLFVTLFSYQWYVCVCVCV